MNKFEKEVQDYKDQMSCSSSKFIFKSNVEESELLFFIFLLSCYLFAFITFSIYSLLLQGYKAQL